MLCRTGFACLPACARVHTCAWLLTFDRPVCTRQIPSTDYGGYVVGDAPARAHLLMKQSGVIAGRPFFDAVFKYLGCGVEWHAAEGSSHELVAGTRFHAATVCGPAHALLKGERVALNVLARCSGVATESRKFAALKAARGFAGVVAGTRKTTPGLRLVEKYAMLVGGVDTHRMDLSSMVMTKDNHVDAAGSIELAVRKARAVCGFSVKVEVEARTYSEAKEAILAGADIVMLDNMAPAQLDEVSSRLRDEFPGGRTLFEVSGGVRLDTIGEYMLPAIDIISTSALHQGVGVVDFSLKIVK